MLHTNRNSNTNRKCNTKVTHQPNRVTQIFKINRKSNTNRKNKTNQKSNTNLTHQSKE